MAYFEKVLEKSTLRKKSLENFYKEKKLKKVNGTGKGSHGDPKYYDAQNYPTKIAFSPPPEMVIAFTWKTVSGPLRYYGGEHFDFYPCNTTVCR